MVYRRSARRGFRGKRRFRRNRGIWFPALGTKYIAGDFSYGYASFSGSSGTVDDERSNGPTQNIFPITRDFTQFSDTSLDLGGPSLRDVVQGQTWRLNRIVGKVNVDVTEDNTTVQGNTWPLVEVAAGFFIARQADSDATLPDLTFEECDPLHVRNVQNPWIWRRSWLLSRPLASNQGYSALPCSNLWMSDEAGCHIDSRMKRLISREHRLWFVIGAAGFSGNLNHTTPGVYQQPYLRYLVDVRVNGQMTAGRQQGDF